MLTLTLASVLALAVLVAWLVALHDDTEERMKHLEDVVTGLAGQIIELGRKPTPESTSVSIESNYYQSSVLDAALQPDED